MKKLFYVLVIIGFLNSCASHPGRVCGGSGGGRCVENTQKKTDYKPIVWKQNYISLYFVLRSFGEPHF